jgi:putative PIN family toxin of toxin-antitoxin system
MNEKPQIVLDTNVLVSALRSSRGASFLLLSRIDSGRFELNVSVALVLEYEEVCKRMHSHLGLTIAEIDDVIDYMCRVANHRKISFLWRPFLDDPDDDMILELAVASECSHIVTFNQSDFAGSNHFGIRVVSPKEMLQEIGELP